MFESYWSCSSGSSRPSRGVYRVCAIDRPVVNFSVIRIKVSIVFFLLTHSVFQIEIVSWRVSKSKSLLFCVCCCLSDFLRCWFLCKIQNGCINELYKVRHRCLLRRYCIGGIGESTRSYLESLFLVFNQIEKKKFLKHLLEI